MGETPAARFFFFNDTATTEIYTLSLHDALPIFPYHLGTAPQSVRNPRQCYYSGGEGWRAEARQPLDLDRKSTRLNSSHLVISYAVFCLKKKQALPAFTDPLRQQRSLRAFYRRST